MLLKITGTIYCVMNNSYPQHIVDSGDKWITFKNKQIINKISLLRNIFMFFTKSGLIRPHKI